MKRIKILIASQNVKNRNQIITALSNQKDFAINVVNDEVETIIVSERLKPNVLIIDLQLTKKTSLIDELELAAIIHRKTPCTSIILMVHKNLNFGKAVIVNIRGFLYKEVDPDEFTLAVLTVLKGAFYISGSCKKFLNDNFTLLKQSINENLSLSPSEKNVITYLAKGYNDYEIAEYLNFSFGTIRNIVTSIKRKTKLRNRIQIILFSIVFDLVDIDLNDLFKKYEVTEKKEES